MEMITVTCVQPINIEESKLVGVLSPSSLKDICIPIQDIGSNLKAVDHKMTPVLDNRDLPVPDMTPIDEDEKVELATDDSNIRVEDLEVSIPECNQSDDRLVSSFLDSLSISRNSNLKELFPDPKTERRRPSIVNKSNIPSDVTNKIRKDSLNSNIPPSFIFSQISSPASLLNKVLHGPDVVQDDEKLRNTKEELIGMIARKVEELCNNQQEVKNEIEETQELGRQVEEEIRGTCNAECYRKYMTYIGDLERVTKLLLNLSRKLIKVDSELHDLDDESKENRENLERVRCKHASRYEDAKTLKQSISQRHCDISDRLKQSLPNNVHEDFTYYASVRCQQLVKAQDIEDRICLGNEQIKALKTNLREQDKDSKETESQDIKDVNGNCDDGHIKPFPT